MRVLIADDGSAGASEGVALAEAIAWPADSAVRVITVIEPIVMPTSGFGGRRAGVAPELDAAIREHAQETLRAVVGRLEAPARTVDGQVLYGRAASMIVNAASEFGADLVIVGSRGNGTIASLLLGSVSGEVVDHAPCPVLVARTRTLSRIVACDRQFAVGSGGRRAPGRMVDLRRAPDQRRQRRGRGPSVDDRDRADDVPTGSGRVCGRPRGGQGRTRPDGRGRRNATRRGWAIS